MGLDAQFAIWLGGTVLALFIYGVVVHRSKSRNRAEVGVVGGFIAALILFVWTVCWLAGSTTAFGKEIDQTACETARTSTKLYAECGGLEYETESKFIYENFNDTTKVRVFRVREANVWSSKVGSDYIEACKAGSCEDYLKAGWEGN